MNTEVPPTLIALVGGSGAGKTWLANRLCQECGDQATSLSLDDFYCDLSHLSVIEREKVNVDHPDAIDWPLFESVLRLLHTGATVLAPRYDFASHTRLTRGQWHSPRPFIFVEGLWLLWPPRMRAQFDLRVFLDCVQSTRWQRRVTRDLKERGRTTTVIHKHFWNVVAPMHDRYVEVQKPWADLVLDHSITQAELGRLVGTIRNLRAESYPIPLTDAGLRAETPPVAALHPL
ncbi:MAG: uridine kinase [Verrucomicrobia bacterium]|nr:uridine kinase [Verrucomicrobiota bacterium]